MLDCVFTVPAMNGGPNNKSPLVMHLAEMSPQSHIPYRKTPLLLLRRLSFSDVGIGRGRKFRCHGLADGSSASRESEATRARPNQWHISGTVGHLFPCQFLACAESPFAPDEPREQPGIARVAFEETARLRHQPVEPLQADALNPDRRAGDAS